MNVKEYMGGGPEEGIPGFSDELKGIEEGLAKSLDPTDPIKEAGDGLKSNLGQIASMSMYQVQGEVSRAGEDIINKNLDMQQGINQQVDKQIGQA